MLTVSVVVKSALLGFNDLSDMYRLYIGYFFLLSLLGLCGCEPTPGNKIDEVEIGAGALRLTLERYKEGTIGNAASGEHYRVLCGSFNNGEGAYSHDQPSSQVLVQQYYRVGRLKLNRLPSERLKVVDDYIAYGFVGGFFVTFDACRTVRYWDINELPKGFLKMDAIVVDPIIVDVEVKRDGYISLELNSTALSNHTQARVVSTDFGASWHLENPR